MQQASRKLAMEDSQEGVAFGMIRRNREWKARERKVSRIPMQLGG